MKVIKAKEYNPTTTQNQRFDKINPFMWLREIDNKNQELKLTTSHHLSLFKIKICAPVVNQ